MKWCLICFDPITEQTDIQERWHKVLLNTGNLVFMHSLKKIIDATPLPWSEAEQNADNFDGIITTSLIFIRENDLLEPEAELLNRYKDKPVVPISVGVQASDLKYNFKFTKEAVKVLKNMEERAVLGVRGDYTAEVLNAHGIKNIQVIGCPSVFYNLDDFKIEKKKLENINTVTSFYSTTGKYFYKEPFEIEYLNYLADNKFTLIRQVRGDNNRIADYSLKFVDNRLFFDAAEWMDFVKGFDFSFGARFHGNVMSVISGLPALFIEVDSRTSEMCRYFKFPTINIESFNPHLSVKDYYDLADYTEFNSIYPIRLRNFREFCNQNNIEIKGGSNCERQ